MLGVRRDIAKVSELTHIGTAVHHAKVGQNVVEMGVGECRRLRLGVAGDEILLVLLDRHSVVLGGELVVRDQEDVVLEPEDGRDVVIAVVHGRRGRNDRLARAIRGVLREGTILETQDELPALGGPGAYEVDDGQSATVAV